MPTLVIRQDTFLKDEPVQSVALSPVQKQEVKKGATYDIASFNQTNQHLKVTLPSGKVLYVFEDHAEIRSETATLFAPQPKAKQLKVPYFPQTDNFTQAERTCNSSAHAMVVAFLKPGAIQSDDEYLRKVIAIGDSTDHTVHNQVLASYGVKSTWRTDLSLEDIYQQITLNKPVTLGIYHRGTLQHPTGGHIIVAIGYTDKGDIVCHDPFGSVLDGYTSEVWSGKEVVYPKHVIEARWLTDGDHTGWGRIFE